MANASYKHNRAAACALSLAASFVLSAPAAAQLEPLPANEAYSAGPPLEYFDMDGWLAAGGQLPHGEPWFWQILPDGIVYQAYLANPKESRMGTQVFYDNEDKYLWDTTLGGRFGIVRFGNGNAARPEGWQFDLEGSAQVRLDPDGDLNLRCVDYRVGGPLTYGEGPHRIKFGYYHLCSHLGDEFVLEHPGFDRLNFVRDVLTLGYAYFLTDDFRVYGELGWAFNSNVSEDWEIQFGFDWAPARPTGIRGAPFLAMNGHLREEHNFGGNFALQAGWAWRADRSTHLLRTGLHYYNGMTNQYSFFQEYEQQIGAGLWYDY